MRLHIHAQYDLTIDITILGKYSNTETEELLQFSWWLLLHDAALFSQKVGLDVLTTLKQEMKSCSLNNNCRRSCGYIIKTCV